VSTEAAGVFFSHGMPPCLLIIKKISSREETKKICNKLFKSQREKRSESHKSNFSSPSFE